MTGILILHLVTFLSAFLLFQIELIVAKMFLPIYGGSYFVWGACLVFFQALLLLGYLFVHWFTRRFGIRRYRAIYLILTFLPFLSFPGTLLNVKAQDTRLFLAGDVFIRLLMTIGPVFFVLSTISVALQRWLSASSLKQKMNPYALYATSNAGSLGALLTYPFLFETLFGLHQQQQIWRLGYLALAVLNLLLVTLVPLTKDLPLPAASVSRITQKERAVWFLLSAGGVMMFMAVTNIITYAIAPIPLLWVLPLSIYLFAFVLSFKTRPWCPRWIINYIAFVLAAAAGLFFLIQNKAFSTEIELLIFCAALFLICLYCQNQLSVHRPSSDGELTTFYLTISLGGFVGGLVTSWVMPLVSKSVIEYLLALTLVGSAHGLIKGVSNKRALSWPIALVPLLLVFFWAVDTEFINGTRVFKKRNYYGIYEVSDMKNIRLLIHGTTMHGAQLQMERIKLEPSAFYSRTSPVGELLLSEQFDFKNLGVVGLGAGALSIYTHPGQTMDFYELDPDIYTICKNYFTYLDNARGKVNVIYGDARLSLDKTPEQRYDILIVDAFGGDAIPFHLLTTEAITKYRTHLTEHGILLFHTSNRYIRLEPMLISAADDLGAMIGYKSTDGRPYGVPSYWVAFTWDREQFKRLFTGFHWYPIAHMIKERHRVWTDDYSNILPVIDVEKIKRTLLKL